METRSNHVLVGAIVLILLVMLALFTIWLARLSGDAEKEYDIFFSQAVDGVNRGSPVAFAGVPSGQVKSISLYKPDPEFVRVRISLKEDVPVLEGTTATIQGIGFTGVSQIQLDGAVKGARPITCPSEATSSACPLGVPVIPTAQGGLGAILNSAPKLLERLSTVTERLTEVLDEENQESIAGILANTERLTDAFADRGPEMAQTIVEMRNAVAQVGEAANQVAQLTATTNNVVERDVGPAMANLNEAVISAQGTIQSLDAAINDARPGLQAFSTQTVPEAGRLVHDLRRTATALASIAEKLERDGASSLVSSQKLPDYEPE